ncbi:MAG: hypothetical protein AAF409_21460 [Pseudomonadota bacterium]
MDQWLDYDLSDFLLFSPQVYWRLFALENAALWPLPTLTSLLAFGALYAATRLPAAGGRALAVLLAIAWIWVGYSFLWQRYAPINWTVGYAAPVFLLQGLGWATVAGWRGRGPCLQVGTIGFLGLALCAIAVVGYPLAGVLSGRTFWEAEFVGIAPDPTVAFAVGAALVILPRWAALLLLPVPLLWLALSTLTLIALDSSQAWFTGAIAICAGIGLIWRLIPRHSTS